VCGRSFSAVDATVACKQLQLGTSGNVLRGAQAQFRAAAASVPIHMSYVECTGGEAGLHTCPYRPGATSGCTHAEDVAIQCGDALPEKTVRLVSTDGDLSAGRLEVWRNNVWCVKVERTKWPLQGAGAHAHGTAASFGFGIGLPTELPQTQECRLTCRDGA